MREARTMTSKHCPYKDTCRERGDCENCDHGLKYEQMGRKIIWLEKEKKAMAAELRAEGRGKRCKNS